MNISFLTKNNQMKEPYNKSKPKRNSASQLQAHALLYSLHMRSYMVEKGYMVKNEKLCGSLQ